MKYTKQDLHNIPIEQAHGGTGSRQMLIQPEYITTPYLEAITKGYIPIGNMFDWHNHIDTDEIFIVTQGEGQFYYRQDDTEKYFDYHQDDVIIAPANLFHKIVAEGSEETQGFFYRVKAKENVLHSVPFTKRNIQDIPFEADNREQKLVTSDMVASEYVDEISKYTLVPNDHAEQEIYLDTDEVTIVLKGDGMWEIEDDAVSYTKGIVLIVQGDATYQQIAKGNIPTECLFIRVKA